MLCELQKLSKLGRIPILHNHTLIQRWIRKWALNLVILIQVRIAWPRTNLEMPTSKIELPM